MINRRKPYEPNSKTLGIKVPIADAPFDGVFDVTRTTIDKVKSQLYVLLFTAPGQRVMLPEFGSSLYNRLFEPNLTSLDAKDLKAQIIADVRKHVPDAKINNITIAAEDNNIKIQIQFALKNNPDVVDVLSIEAKTPR